MDRPKTRQEAVRFLEISLELVRVETNARTLLSKVVPELVSLGHHPLHHCLLPSEPSRDQEERRPGVMAAQLGQDSRGGAGVGAIVQREGHEAGPGLNPVQTPGKNAGQPIEEPGMHDPIYERFARGSDS